MSGLSSIMLSSAFNGDADNTNQRQSMARRYGGRRGGSQDAYRHSGVDLMAPAAVHDGTAAVPGADQNVPSAIQWRDVPAFLDGACKTPDRRYCEDLCFTFRRLAP
jgi:hypothetical protein